MRSFFFWAWMCLTTIAQELPIQFEEVSKSSGIQFHHSDGSSGNRYIVETVTSGLAIFDYDGDGLKDVFLLTGQPLPGNPNQKSAWNALYRNNGDWTFTDVTASAGLDSFGYGLGVVAADYDEDGHLDLYLSHFGPSVLYRNRGDGTFEDVTKASGIENDQFAAGAVFADVDGDGLLDLYQANYVQFSFDKHRVRTIAGHQFHPGPHDYPPAPDKLFKNQGNGTFADISQESGIQSVAAPGMGVIAGDFDEDGDCDIFVANDSYPNFLWINDGQGHFTENAVIAGLAVDRSGRENGNMGVECADFNGDLLLDFFSTTYQDEMPVLYLNRGSGLYEDATNVSRIPNSLHPHVNWGVGAEDFDLDGDRDLFIACGHFMDNIRFIDDRTECKVSNYLLLNEKGRFQDATKIAGEGLQIIESSRGAAFDDLDNDGDIDAVVLNVNTTPSVLRNNRIRGPNSWLRVRLVGITSNRWGVGAQIVVSSNGIKQTAMVHAGRGYQSAYAIENTFGLGEASSIDFVEVRWPDGATQKIHSPPLGMLTIIQQRKN